MDSVETDPVEPARSRTGYSRITNALLGTAFLLLMLGLANVIYGTVKIRESARSLSSAKRELSRPNSSPFPLVDSTLTADQGTLRIKNLQSSLDYYTLVRSGGKFFMLLGVLALLAAIIAERRLRPEIAA